MGLTRHQQNAQAITDAVDLDYGAVVAGRQFALRLGQGELQDIHAAMGQDQRHL